MADNIAGTILGQTTVFESWVFEFLVCLRPNSTSNEAWFTLGSQQYGSKVFNTLHPLISSNFRVKEEEKLMLIPIRERTWVAIMGKGLSPSSRSKMRVSGRAAANWTWYDLVDNMETSSSSTCSALAYEFVSSMRDTIERGEPEPGPLDAG